MKNFAALCNKLDEASAEDKKLNLLAEYFDSSNPDDSVWAVYFLTGKRIKQIISAVKLKEWSAELTRIPDWLFDESFKAVGNLVETITLLLPKTPNSQGKSLHYWIEKLLALRKMEEGLQREESISAWINMNTEERYIWNKLITGSFRMGYYSKLVVKALSMYSGNDEPVIYSRLIGDWKPDSNFFKHLVSGNTKDIELCKPYPFYSACRLDDDVENLGEVKRWQAEWKWSGIRSQIIKRDEKIFIWSHYDEMLNEYFPEIESLKFLIPDGIVIDGNIIAWQDEKPLHYRELQRRIGKKNITKKLMNDIPVVFMAHDLLELYNKDIRDELLNKRRKKLLELIISISDRRLLFSYKIN